MSTTFYKYQVAYKMTDEIEKNVSLWVSNHRNKKDFVNHFNNLYKGKAICVSCKYLGEAPYNSDTENVHQTLFHKN